MFNTLKMSDEKTSQPSFLPQLLSTMAISLCTAQVGTFFSYGSIAVPSMRKDESIQGGSNPGGGIALEEGSWIISSLFIGLVPGCILGGILSSYFGSRRTLLLACPFVLASEALIAYTNNLYVIYLARVICGLFYGLCKSNVSVYNAEVTHKDFRGTTGTFIAINLSFGMLLPYLGSYFFPQWRILSMMMMSVPVISIITISCIQDSPYWLIQKNRQADAKKALQILRGSKYDVNPELQEIIKKKISKDSSSKSDSLLRTLCSKLFWIPFSRVATLMCLTQFGGMSIVNTYLISILELIMKNPLHGLEENINLSKTVISIIITMIRLFFAFIAAWILKVCPRRQIFLISAIIIAICQSTIGTFLYYKETRLGVIEEYSLNSTAPNMMILPTLKMHYEEFMNNYQLIPIICTGLIQACETVGFFSVIQLLVAESFTTEIRSIGCGLTGVITGSSIFVVTKGFPSMLNTLGNYGTFWFFGCVMIIVITHGYIFMPENKGDSLVKTEDKMIKSTSNIA